MDASVFPIIGMSPGNSYFKDDEVRYLLETVVRRFGKTAILIADIPAISTYQAMGYPENKARNKAIPKANNLKNRTRRIAHELGISDKVRIVEWSTEIAGHDHYNHLYRKVRGLYDSNALFAGEVNNTTQTVLLNADRPIQDMESAIQIGIHYLLSELAFLELAPTLLGSDKVTYVYHKNWPVYEDYVAGKFDNQPKLYLDFLLLENPNETYKSFDLEAAYPYADPEPSRIMDKILRCSFCNYPPSFIVDPKTGKFSGIFHDIIMEIARRQSFEVRWIEESGYGVITDRLRQEQFDLFCAAVWPTPERTRTADFSLPVYHSNVGMWVREGDIRSVASTDLRDNAFFRIAIKEGDISHSIAAADFPRARFVRIPQLADTTELLRFVADDRADATFVEPYLANLFNHNNGFRLFNIAETPIRRYPNTFMLGQGRTELKLLLDSELEQMIASGFVSDLIVRYTGREDTFECTGPDWQSQWRPLHAHQPFRLH